MNASLSAFADELVKLGAAPKSILTPGSSNIKGWRYDAKTKQMFVTFKGGSTYRYNGVPPSAARSLKRSKSVGKAVNRQLKAPGYAYEKVAKKKKQKSYKCKFCKDRATKGVIWAEGRGIVPCCDKHLAKGKAAIADPSDIDLIRDLTKQANGDAWAALRDSRKKINAQERARFGTGNGKPKKRPTAQVRFYTNSYKTPSKAKKTPTQRYYERKRRLAKIAGAAKKQVTWQGVTMKLEYLTGDERSGVNGATGKSWSRTMKDNYGYMPGTYGKGADGEAIDVYFSPKPSEEGSKVVYKIRQKKKTGEYDEDKFMVGYASGEEAKRAFLRNMPEWAFDSMTGMSMGRFRTVVGQPARKAA